MHCFLRHHSETCCISVEGGKTPATFKTPGWVRISPSWLLQSQRLCCLRSYPILRYWKRGAGQNRGHFMNWNDDSLTLQPSHTRPSVNREKLVTHAGKALQIPSSCKNRPPGSTIEKLLPMKMISEVLSMSRVTGGHFEVYSPQSNKLARFHAFQAIWNFLLV
jgi:hypothetical protein